MMEIKTKLRPGNQAYFMHKNEVAKGTIDEIVINVSPNKETPKGDSTAQRVDITYRIDGVKTPQGGKLKLSETKAFLSKEELLKSL
jgi:hypothetical protein